MSFVESTTASRWAGEVVVSKEPSPRWFAVYTAPRHEKRIAEHLTSRRIEHFLPLYSIPRRWRDGSRGVLQLPLFPGYLFVRISNNERARVLGVPGVHTMIGSGREPLPLPDNEIDTLRSGLHLRNCKPHPLLTVGQRARIKRGPLAGFEGVIVRKNNDWRIVLTLDLIQQSVIVEISAADMEPVPPRLSSA